MSIFGKTIFKTPLKTAKTSNGPFSAVRGSYGPRFHRLFNGRSIFSILVFSKQLANYMVTTTLADPNLDLKLYSLWTASVATLGLYQLWFGLISFQLFQLVIAFWSFLGNQPITRSLTLIRNSVVRSQILTIRPLAILSHTLKMHHFVSFTWYCRHKNYNQR